MSITSDFIKAITARAQHVEFIPLARVKHDALVRAKTDLDFRRELITEKEPGLDQPVRVERYR